VSLLVPDRCGRGASVTDADRLSALAVADRGVFQALTAMRLNRAAVQTAIQADDDPLGKINELHAQSARPVELGRRGGTALRRRRYQQDTGGGAGALEPGGSGVARC